MCEEIVIGFNLDNERDKRIFSAIKRMPSYMKGDDFSEAIIGFMKILFQALVESEEKKRNVKTSLITQWGECEALAQRFLAYLDHPLIP